MPLYWLATVVEGRKTEGTHFYPPPIGLGVFCRAFGNYNSLFRPYLCAAIMT